MRHIAAVTVNHNTSLYKDSVVQPERIAAHYERRR